MKVYNKMEVIFEYINDIINPQEKWEKIVKKNEWKLRKVPLEYLTQKMCNEAVENNHDVLCCVPDRFKTRRMCVIKRLINVLRVSETFQSSL